MTIPSAILVNASILRTQLTDAEQLLWYLLRDRRFCGVKFRRQHPFDRFVLDFYCHDAKLAVELDGSGHTNQVQRDYDDERTLVLKSEGIKVLRFWNNEVLSSLDEVLEKLYAELFDPSPGALRHPLPDGEGKLCKTPSIAVGPLSASLLPWGEGVPSGADEGKSTG